MLTFMDKRIAVFGVFLVAIGGACFAQSPIDADLDGNESVDGRDIFAFVAQWQASQVVEATGTQVGWEATLEPMSPTYEVSGKAIVTSATSIRLENFSYLNNGPDVHVYLVTASGDSGFTNQEGAAGLSIFDFSNNNAEPYVGVTQDIELPEGVTIQPYTHVSVWCRLAGVDFGSGKFVPQ
ncbi:MAG: DM13 domain-containing protein [Candidatus Omnitrophica bacterium]|nr:DM13 domain-containing protein [Candidatus Omnitrophota bacterium]